MFIDLSNIQDFSRIKQLGKYATSTIHYTPRKRSLGGYTVFSLSVFLSLYPPQTVFVGGYTVFTLSVRPSVRVYDGILALHILQKKYTCAAIFDLCDCHTSKHFQNRPKWCCVTIFRGWKN